MKRILVAALVAAVGMILNSCGNKDLFDTVYRYDRAIITLPDGEIIEGQVENWTDYEDGEQIQVKIDGKIYLVHAENICLIAGEG